MSLPSQPIGLPPGSESWGISGSDGFEYRILVSRPEAAPPPSGYPVVWLLDGQAFFGAVNDSIQVRSARSDATGVPPMLVVGIAHATPGGRDRLRRQYDFTPDQVSSADSVGASDHDGNTGGAKDFGTLLLGPLRDQVLQRYPADSSRQLLLAHSLAGLFAFDLLTRSPESFTNWQLISPSLWWLTSPALNAAVERLHRTPAASPVQVTMSAGEYENGLAPWEVASAQAEVVLSRRQRRGVVHLVSETARRLLVVPGLTVNERIYQGEDHVSTVFRVINDALRNPFSCLASSDEVREQSPHGPA